LCGKTDHRAVDGCPNMVSDNGRRVNILPSKDTCQACPWTRTAEVRASLCHLPLQKGGHMGREPMTRRGETRD
jgi:hypothetical protein